MKDAAFASGNEGAVFVSVPLRGSGFESRDYSNRIIFQPVKFQSPCGEVVLKGFGFRDYSRSCQFWFQSPCGEVVLKAVRLLTEEEVREVFQSPCGEVVLKEFSAFVADDGRVFEFQSPCGEVVLKVLLDLFSIHARSYVSVPLRGSGFERKPSSLGNSLTGLSFSPLAGKWF